MEAIPER
jgi:predicted ATPase